MARDGLIITADDFGAAEAVNVAVEQAHRDGVLTAASLMVGGAAVADAVARARRTPDLHVGLHIVLVDGAPVLPPEQVPRLVDVDGRFHRNMALAGASMFFNPQTRRELAAEIDAQFKAFANTGLALDHVNAHKHFHLHPTIAAAIFRIGARYGARAIRAPIEPVVALRRVEPSRASPALASMASQLRARCRRRGWLAPDQVFGLAWSGAMTARRLAGLVEGLPPGLSEIYLHPAVNGAFEGATAGYRYADELAALTAASVRQAIAARRVRLGGFADFSIGRHP